MATKSRADLELRATDKATRTFKRFQNRLQATNRTLRRSERRFQLFSKRVEKSLGSIRRLGKGMMNVGKRMSTALTLPVVAAGGIAINEFRKFQKGLIGLGKTTDIQGTNLRRFGKAFIEMSKRIPLTARQLLALGEAAGQMGIRGKKNILTFAETMAKLQFTTNVAGEEGARSIARILKVTNEGPAKIKPFADTLVFLGNTLEATEAEILKVANRVAGNTARFGLGSKQVLTLAGAFKSLGKESELVGSVTGRVFNSIQQAILDGGKNKKGIKTLRILTGGLSKLQLKEQFKTKPVEVFLKVLRGLEKVTNSDKGNFVKVLKNLGLEGVRINDVVGTAVKSLDTFQKKLDEVKAGKDVGALGKEFGQFLKSLDADIVLTKNVVISKLIKLGEKLAPAFKKGLAFIRSTAEFLDRNPGFAKLLAVMAGIAAITGPLVAGLGALAFGIVQVNLALPVLLPLLATAKAGMLGFLTAGSLATFGAVALAIGGVTAALIQINKHWPSLKDATLTEFLNFANHEFNNLLETLTSIADFLSGGRLKASIEANKPEAQRKAREGDFGARGIGGGFLGLPRKVPQKGSKQGIDVNQKAELNIKVEGPAGTTANVKDQKGFDKIMVNRGFQGAF